MDSFRASTVPMYRDTTPWGYNITLAICRIFMQFYGKMAAEQNILGLARVVLQRKKILV